MVFMNEMIGVLNVNPSIQFAVFCANTLYKTGPLFIIYFRCALCWPLSSL